MDDKTATTTLLELIEEYGANGVIRIDAGSGSAGPAWIEWDDEMADEIGDVVMHGVNPQDDAYADPDDEYYGRRNPQDDTIEAIAKLVVRDYSVGEMWASAWITDGDGDNAYRYRLIF